MRGTRSGTRGGSIRDIGPVWKKWPDAVNAMTTARAIRPRRSGAISARSERAPTAVSRRKTPNSSPSRIAMTRTSPRDSNPETSASRPADRHHDLPLGLAARERAVRVRQPLERKPRSDDRTDPAGTPFLEDLRRSPAKLVQTVREEREDEPDQGAARRDERERREETHRGQLAQSAQARDAPLPGRCGEAVEHVPPSARETPPQGAERRSPDRVDDDVRTVARESVAAPGGGVESDPVGAEVAAQRELPLRADQRDRLRAAQRQELEQRGPDATGRGGDDDGLAGPDLRLVDRVPSGQMRDRHRGGFGEIDAFGKRKHGRLAADDALGVSTEDRDRHDRPAGSDVDDSGTDRFDDARDLHAGHERRAWRIRIDTRPREEIGEVEGNRRGPDRDLSGAGLGIGALAKAEALRSAVPIDEPGARCHRRANEADSPETSGCPLCVSGLPGNPCCRCSRPPCGARRCTPRGPTAGLALPLPRAESSGSFVLSAAAVAS